MGEKLFADPFLKNHNQVCVWINCLKFYSVKFYKCANFIVWLPSWDTGQDVYLFPSLQPHKRLN